LQKIFHHAILKEKGLKLGGNIMKKRKLKKAIGKSIGMILILLTIVSTASGCLTSSKSNVLVGGALLETDREAQSGESHPVRLAFKNETDRFDIGDVTLEFLYGGVWGELDATLQGSYNYPYFEIGFENDEGQKVIVKEVEENLVSEKYRYVIKYDLDGNGSYYVSERKFNHSEELTIPKELFTKTYGSIVFALYGENIAPGCSNGFSMIQFLRIYYHFNSSTGNVFLSTEKMEAVE
jgi:hypothetical protein